MITETKKLAPLIRVYLSGPMTGKPDLNFPLFNAEATRLREYGYVVVNPAEVHSDATPDHDYFHFLREDIKLLCDCHVIALLPGWENSNGASFERYVAHKLNIQVAMASALGKAS